MVTSFLQSSGYAPKDMMTGEELKKAWGSLVGMYLLDETASDFALPLPVEECLYYIEQNPTLLFTIYDYVPVSIPVH